MSILNKVRVVLSAANLLDADILAAVSGGADSVSLFHCLRELKNIHGGRLEMAHVDHRLRPCSGEDAAFCLSLAKESGVPFHSLSLSSSDFGNEKPSQAATRRLRYDFFQRLMFERNLQATALGHHLDDQVETALFRIIRGTGPRGSAGMDVWSPPWIRPFLGVRRAEIEELADAEGWNFREDPTNKKAKYSRNKIRLELLPLIRSIHGSPEKSIARFIRLAADDDKYLSKIAHGEISKNIVAEPDGFRFSVGELKVLDQAIRRRVYLALWRMTGRDSSKLEMKHLEIIDDLLGSGSAQRTAPLPGEPSFVRSYEDLWILRQGILNGRCGGERIHEPGRHEIEGFGFDVVWSSEEGPPKCCVEIPLDRGAGGLWIRQWAPGDRVDVGAGKMKKVKDVLMDAKVPSWRRKCAVLLSDDVGRLGLATLGFAVGGQGSGASRFWIDAVRGSCNPEFFAASTGAANKR